MLLHRSMSTANDAISMAKMAQVIPMVANSETAAKTTVVGASADAQGGLVDEACVCSMAAAAANPCQRPPGL